MSIFKLVADIFSTVMKVVKYFFMYGCTILVLSILSSCKKSDHVKMEIDNTFPWCIVAFDSVNRTPEQRIQLLDALEFKKYAYDWRDHHLDDMQREISLAKESGIEVISVWLWLNAKRDSPGKLSPSNQRIFEIIKESQLETELWISFNNNFFEDLSQAQCLAKASDLVGYIGDKAFDINCNVALYNHTGWFGEPFNQVEIIKDLPQYDLKIVYNFHHGHEHIDNFSEIVELILPHLTAVNLNGMRKGGPKILPIGQGDHEREMIQILLNKGYNGPWGILGHVEDADVKYVLDQNIDGLNNLFN